MSWSFYGRDSTTVVSVDEAVGSFRDVADADALESHCPEPSVYLYETVGDEHIDALGGATHTYPAQTTMSVTLTDCGYRVRWDVFKERFDELDLCVSRPVKASRPRQYRSSSV